MIHLLILKRNQGLQSVLGVYKTKLCNTNQYDPLICRDSTFLNNRAPRQNTFRTSQATSSFQQNTTWALAANTVPRKRRLG